MAAIVRVKRRRNEDPADSLLISCKRARSDAAGIGEGARDQFEVKCQVKFAGTMLEKDASVSAYIREAIRKEKLSKEYQRENAYAENAGKSNKLPRSYAKTRKKENDNNHYKVISKKRSHDLDSLDKDEIDTSGPSCEKLLKESAEDCQAEKKFHLYDVICDNRVVSTVSEEEAPQAPAPEVVTCNGVPMIREQVPPNPRDVVNAEAEIDYVYDIYYLNKRDFDYRALENILLVEACRGPLEFGEYREPDEEVYDDEDDSNDEDNWRNDYPDEDPRYYDPEYQGYDYTGDADDMFGGDELSCGMNYLTLGRHQDLSSDEEDSNLYEDYMYNHGPRISYERYLSKVRKEMGEEGDDEEESDVST